MIGIIDYGMGNLYSVQNALKKLNVSYQLVSTPEQVFTCDKLILPGVGAFKDCMKNLNQQNLVQAIQKAVKEKHIPLMGICLGMQVLFEDSTEKGMSEGLGLIKGHVRKMEQEGLRVPHMGWNQLVPNQDCSLFDGRLENNYVYFVHSYFADDIKDENLIAYAQYGDYKVPGIVAGKHVFGTQFHPEKSGEDGMRILQYFVEEWV